jgi:hypothetical protein
MNSIVKHHSKLIERIIDFIVLSTLFFLSCQIVPWSFDENIVVTSIIYAVVVIISIQLCNKLVQSVFKSTNSVIGLMLTYATGLLIGTCAMLAIAMLAIGFNLSSMQGLSAVVILASIMAFFVLGTVFPLARFDRHVTQ